MFRWQCAAVGDVGRLVIPGVSMEPSGPNSNSQELSSMARYMRSEMQTRERDLEVWRHSWWLAKSHRDVASMAVCRKGIRCAKARIRFLRRLALPGELD